MNHFPAIGYGGSGASMAVPYASLSSAMAGGHVSGGRLRVIELAADAPAIDFRSLRFLVVDDDRDQRYFLCRTLAAMGTARVVEAPSGHEALAILDRLGQAVDIVVADLQMPGMDGMELVRRIGERKLPVSVILVSGLDGVLLASAATMAQAYGVRVIGTIEKPATRAKFYTVLGHFRTPAPAAAAAADVVFAPSAHDVLSGISAGQIEPFFQGVVELRSGNVVGADRWRGGDIPGAGFSGRKCFFRRWRAPATWTSCRGSCCHWPRWKGLWRRAGLQMTVSVNVSATSLADPGYAEAVTQIVTGHGLDPSEMILELTETEAILNIAAALENLTRLRIRGFGLAIDDYGVGYNSMQALSRMPFTEIKIDRSFVAAATGDPKYRLMIEHTIAVAHQLGLKTVAEGVETRLERDLLATLGCDRIQGYFLAKPLQGSEFLRWMVDRRASTGPESLRPPQYVELFGT
jgi:EAL domain-containing protein (putative c-di-GMP-specific phosphodiesterase class I)/FixJ family two-component response regulator